MQRLHLIIKESCKNHATNHVSMTATRKRDLRELLVLLRLLSFNIMPEIGMKDHCYGKKDA